MTDHDETNLTPADFARTLLWSLEFFAHPRKDELIRILSNAPFPLPDYAEIASEWPFCAAQIRDTHEWIAAAVTPTAAAALRMEWNVTGPAHALQLQPQSRITIKPRPPSGESWRRQGKRKGRRE